MIAPATAALAAALSGFRPGLARRPAVEGPGRILLHVGTHKTGTTAIQQALLDAAPALRARGILYPNAAWSFGGHPGRSWGAAQFRFAAALADPEDRHARRLAAFRQRLSEGVRSHDKVVLSAESLYRHLLAPRGAALSEAERRAAREAYVGRLADFFEGFEVEVVICFRRPDSFAESVYQEVAASTGSRMAFAAFLRRDAFRWDYAFQLGLLARHFPVRAFGFEAAAAEGPVEHFFRELGLGEPPPATGPHRASVPKRAASWLLRHKAPGRPSAAERRARRRRWLFALQEGHRPLFPAPPGAGFWRDARERDRFLAASLRGLDAVRFPDPPGDVRPLPPWTEAEDAAVEAAFRDWQARHRTRLLLRELRGQMPYEDPELG